MIAFALDTIPNHAVAGYLDSYFEKEQVEGIVIGLPLHLDGSDQQMTGLVLEFVKSMRRRYKDKWVETIDERFTSSMAQQTLISSGVKKKKRQDKGALDRISATIILQSFLEQRG
jgi:putative Holliday junction resolvase